MSLDFLRKPNDTIRIGRDYDNPDEDAWDDRELIKAYDSSIKGFRKQKKKLKENHPELADAQVPGPWVEVNSASDYAYQQPLLYSTDEPHAYAGAEAEVPTEPAENMPETYEGEGEDEEYEDAQYEDEYDEEEEEEEPQYQAPSSSRRQPDLSSQFQLPNIFMPPIPKSASGQDLGRGTLPSLLTSWYMSGYHAGYFDAKQEFKREQMEQHRRKSTKRK